MAPFPSTTIFIRFAIDATSFLAPGYARVAFRHLWPNCLNVSEGFEAARRLFSAPAQTCSCEFKSGEYFGQPSSNEIFCSFIAAFAGSARRSGSPSRRMRNDVFVGNAFFKNGPTFCVTSFAHLVESKGFGGTRNASDLPVDVVSPKTFCFLTFFQSLGLNQRLPRTNAGLNFSSDGPLHLSLLPFHAPSCQ